MYCNLVQWWSSGQDLIAKSTCEAELIASSETLQQGENIAIVVTEMTKVSNDNAASLHMIRNGSMTAYHSNVKRKKTDKVPLQTQFIHIKFPKQVFL